MKSGSATATELRSDKQLPRLDTAIVSVSDLVYDLRGAVQGALRKTNEFGIASPGIRILPAPGPIIGIALKERDFSESRISDFLKLAREMVSHVSDVAERAQPAVLIIDRRIVIGLVLTPNMIEFGE